MGNHYDTRLLKCIINSGVRKLVFPAKINTMKFFLIIFLIVCCVCHQVDSAPPRRSPPPPPPVPSYTVIQMVMSWPPTSCNSGNHCKAWTQIRKNFGLHGLWPADDKGVSVTDCSGPNIPTYSTPEALKSYLSKNPQLDTDLSTYWPSVLQSEQQGYPLWQRQWNKHGVCSYSKISPPMTYFEKSVEQSKKHFDLLGVLAGSNIVPSNTELYTVTQIESAVQRKIGTKNHVYISCLKIGQEIMLLEIFICLDDKAGGYVPCPVNKDTKACESAKPQGWIKFPPFPYTLIQMVMLWPPTYCKSGNPCKAWNLIRKNFGLHGLWPADRDGDGVNDCRGLSIPTYSSPAALKAYLSKNPKLDKELSTYWPSVLQSEQGYSFWQGQWNKHGVCSNSEISTMTYFEKAAEQSKKHFDLLGVLAGGNIVPSDTELYTVTQIESAVQRKIGTNNHVYVSCLKMGQEIMLREIFICLDSKARGYVSCPVKQDTRGCGMAKPKGWIKFPKFPKNHQGQPGPIADLGFSELAVDNILVLL